MQTGYKITYGFKVYPLKSRFSCGSRENYLLMMHLEEWGILLHQNAGVVWIHRRKTLPVFSLHPMLPLGCGHIVSHVQD